MGILLFPDVALILETNNAVFFILKSSASQVPAERGSELSSVVGEG